MADKQNLKKSFEAILGQELPIDFAGEILLRERTGAYTLVPKGMITSREIGTTGKSTRRCYQWDIFDLSGASRTGNDGKIEFLLSDFFCEEIEFDHPVNFLVTVRSNSPVFLTSLRSLTDDRRDVKITVFSWNSSGESAANITFDWRCRVPYIPIID